MALSVSGVLDTPCEQPVSQPDCSVHDCRGTLPAIRVVRTLPELEELRGIWDQWCDDPTADIDIYLASARCRPDFVRPHVMVVYREGRPDCMLIGRLERRRQPLKVGYTTLFAPLVNRLFFLQGGLLGNASEENTRLLLEELKQCLHHGEADCAELGRVVQDANLYKAAMKEFGFFCRGHFSPLHTHRWLELPGSFEEFLRSMPRKSRHELRRHQKRLDDDFSKDAHIRCYRHEGEVTQLAGEVEKVAAKTYQRGLGVGFSSNAEIVASLRTMARKGGLRGCVLYLGEEPCAFFIGKHYKDTFHGNFMGFDPHFSKYSPGLLVLMHSIEECFDPDFRAVRVDLGWGDRQFKRELCNHSRLDGPIHLYALSWAGLKLNLLRSTTALLDLAARWLLARSSCLQKLKRAWHARVQTSQACPTGSGLSS